MTSPVQFPNPAVMEVTHIDFDPVTEDEEEITGTRIIGGIAFGPAEGGISVGWDDDDTVRGVILSMVEDQGDWITGTSVDGQPYRFRDLDPYDAVTMSAAGVPQPLMVVQAHVIRGGVLAQQLDAVVAADNTVATLMLETGMGTFVRYSGDWQLLGGDSDSLEDMSLVEVAPGALNVWDAADAATQTISIFDLPRPDGQGGITEPNGEPDIETAAAIAASGISIPQINSVEDLDLGVRYGNTHPQARWYVTKRASALNASAHIPAHWNVAAPAVVPPFSMAGEEMEL